ncbi:MAG: hypothetical protein RL264_2964 [Bacteroidota bacterium]
MNNTLKINYLMKKILVLLLFLIGNFIGFSQSRYISETTKKAVYARDRGVCQCCGSSSNLEYDHIVPFSCGGESTTSNVQLLCMSCNRSKSNSCYCKIHDKKVGSNCCDGASTSNSSHSTASAQQCTGTTKKGARCKNRTTNSNGRCHLHQ